MINGKVCGVIPQLMLGPRTNVDLLALTLLPRTETYDPSAELSFEQEVEQESM